MGAGHVHEDAVFLDAASTEMIELPADVHCATFPANEPGIPFSDVLDEVVAAAKGMTEALAVVHLGDGERAGYRARIQDLLEAGTRHADAARAARRAEAEARFEADVWRRKALEAWAVVGRMRTA